MVYEGKEKEKKGQREMLGGRHGMRNGKGKGKAKMGGECEWNEGDWGQFCAPGWALAGIQA